MERTLSTVLLSLALSSAACGSDLPPAEELATRSLAISDELGAGLTPVTDDAAGAVIVRELALPGAHCVGVLLTNQWVLTSGVCVDDAAPDNVQVELPASGATRLAAEIHSDGQFGGVALIRLRSPFVIQGSSSRHYIPLYDGEVTSLRGKTLRCYGKEYPRGALRTAEFPVQSVSSQEYVLGENSKQQQLWVYDDGAPCLLSSGPAAGMRYVTGIMNYFRRDMAGHKLSEQRFAGAFREWVYKYVPPQIQITSTDLRLIENLQLSIEFSINGQRHEDDQALGRFDHVISNRLYAYGGRWDGSKWVGDFLSTVRHDYSVPGTDAVPRVALIRKEDPRAVRGVRLHARFTIGGELHEDFEDLGDFVSTKNLTLNAIGGRKVQGTWRGDFLRSCQTPTCR